MVKELGSSSSGANRMWTAGDQRGDFGYNNHYFVPLHQNNDDFIYRLQHIEDANKILRQTTKQNQEEVNLFNTLMRLGPLGLQLHLTPAFVDLLDKKLNQTPSETKAHSPSNNYQAKVNDFGSQPISEKLKASNFSASFLRIGTWERASKNEGDLVAKCYFAKKKLVWEFLERGLKSKIEIQWSDIIAIRAVIKPNDPGTLELELNQAPSFHEETDPQPRKHTIWKVTSDFTGGQASICRRHYLVFPNGSLDKHYEKLLQCEPRLLRLSQQPFPSLPSPFFHPNIYGLSDLSFNYNRGGPDPNYGIPFSLSSIPSQASVTPSIFQSYELAAATHQSSSNKKPSPISDEQSSNNLSRLGLRCRGINDSTNSLRRGQVQGLQGLQSAVLPHPVTVAAVPCQNYNLQSYGQEAGLSSYDANVFRDIESHLLSDMQVVNYDEKSHIAKVESLNALVNLSNEENPASGNSLQQTFIGQEVGADEKFVLGGNEHSNITGGQSYQQPSKVFDGNQQLSVVLGANQQHENIFGGQFYQQLHVPSQISSENTFSYQTWNNLPYVPVHDHTLEDFDPAIASNRDPANTSSGTNHWS